jgi:arylsulfatase A-like enzyme
MRKVTIGFPGFDGMEATVSLAYVAALQEHGVPITFTYISDAHDNHPSGPAFGPGSAGYVAALKAYDDAFNKFFTRLATDGITRDNTLFIFTSDEGGHFVGGPPSPANCDGVTIPCTYAQIGEISTNLAGLLATEQGITTPFKTHSDDAPTIYITGNPVRTDPVAAVSPAAWTG